VLDGEAVVLGVDGVSDFNALHSREPAQCRPLDQRAPFIGETPLNTACVGSASAGTWSRTSRYQQRKVSRVSTWRRIGENS